MSVNKIFQIGFNKCGTVSIHKFFIKNGLKSVHWDKGNLANTIKENHENNLPILKGYEDFDCFSDMENVKMGLYIPILYFKELDKQYPNSKFILNVRPIDNWIKSRLNHGKYLEISKETLNLSEEEIIELWKKQWNTHINEVKEYFKERPNDLCIFDIETEGDKFIKYIGNLIELKIFEFPHRNKTRKNARIS
jgi:hypothetical protein